jgi:hypothetical protein
MLISISQCEKPGLWPLLLTVVDKLIALHIIEHAVRRIHSVGIEKRHSGQSDIRIRLVAVRLGRRPGRKAYLVTLQFSKLGST